MKERKESICFEKPRNLSCADIILASLPRSFKKRVIFTVMKAAVFPENVYFKY